MSQDCIHCITFSQWFFTIGGIYFTINYFKVPTYPNRSAHILGLISPPIFFGMAYYQHMKKQEVLKELIKRRDQDKSFPFSKETSG